MSKLLSLRRTILKAYGSKHFCYVFRTAAKGCTCWKSCWFLITAGSSHVLHSVLPHHTKALKPSQEEWRYALAKLTAIRSQLANHFPSSAPRKDSSLIPCWYFSTASGFFVLPTARAKKCSPSKWSLKTVKYVQDVLLHSKQMQFWQIQIASHLKLSLHVLPLAQGILCSSVLKPNLQV